MINLDRDIWYWYHNVSECYYHIQITVKYRKALLNNRVQAEIIEVLKGFKERYAVEISEIGFDQNHIHLLYKFLPKYSGGEVIRLIKSITARQILGKIKELKEELWGGEFWTEGYYIATISGRGNKEVIVNYIRNQGREEDIKQLEMFDMV
jgi:putative transposase